MSAEDWALDDAGRWHRIEPRSEPEPEPAPAPETLTPDEAETRAWGLAYVMVAHEWSEHALKQALARERELVEAHARLEAAVAFLNRTLVTLDESCRLHAWGRQ